MNSNGVAVVVTIVMVVLAGMGGMIETRLPLWLKRVLLGRPACSITGVVALEAALVAWRRQLVWLLGGDWNARRG